VDPVVEGAGVLGHEGERARELGANRGRPRSRTAVLLPPVVGMQVQQRLGGEQRHAGMTRVAAREGTHALRVGVFVEDAIARVAQGQRIDQRTLHRRGAVRMPARLAKRPVHAWCGLRAHVGVDVRPQRPGQCPPATRAGRVQCHGLLQRSRGLFGIEAVDEQHALFDVAPHAPVVRLDREPVAIEPAQQRSCRHVCGRLLPRGCRQGTRGACQDRQRCRGAGPAPRRQPAPHLSGPRGGAPRGRR